MKKLIFLIFITIAAISCKHKPKVCEFIRLKNGDYINVYPDVIKDGDYYKDWIEKTKMSSTYDTLIDTASGFQLPMEKIESRTKALMLCDFKTQKIKVLETSVYDRDEVLIEHKVYDGKFEEVEPNTPQAEVFYAIRKLAKQ